LEFRSKKDRKSVDYFLPICDNHTTHRTTQHKNMRTKTLLLTAAIGAVSIASSMAQAVYSVNAVGYVNTQVPPGFSLIANPLIQAQPTLAALIPNPPPLTTVYKYVNGVGYNISTFDDLDLAWLPDPNATLDLGDGFFIFNPAAAFTITFVGEVAEGNPLSTALPPGFSIRSSKVPQADDVVALGLVGQPFDTIYKYVNGVGYQIFTYDDLDLAWLPSVPELGVGEAFFFFNAGPLRQWTRVFDVTP